MKFFVRLTIITLLALLAGCGEDGDRTRNNDFVPLTGITVNSDRAQVPAGFLNQFTAIGNFSDAFIRENLTGVTWASSDPETLAFDDPNSGVGRGIKPGPVQIIAQREGVTGRLDFTVNAATLQSIAVTPPESPSLPKGLTLRLTATGTFSDQSTLPLTNQVKWSTSNAAVATVDANGVATAVTVGGPIDITAGPHPTAPTVTGVAKLTVTAPTVQSVTLDPPSAVIPTETTVQFTATARFSDNTTRDVSTTATWTSSAPAIASVSTSGVALALTSGTTDISARFLDVSSSPAPLTVAVLNDIQVTSVTGVTTISLRDPVPTLQLKATGRFAGVAGLQDITTLVDWSTVPIDSTVATVGTKTGLVQGVTPGVVTIQAKKGTIGSINITVQQ